jgi:hypothetical protein
MYLGSFPGTLGDADAKALRRKWKENMKPRTRDESSQRSLTKKLVRFMALSVLGLLAVVPAQLRAQEDTSSQDGEDAITRINWTSNESQAGPTIGVLANTQTFTYTGSSQYLTVPEGATEMQFRVVGGQGGKTIAEAGSNVWFKGGDGADITGRAPVTPGQRLIVFVGQYGGNGDYNRNPGQGGIGAFRNGGRGGGGQNRDGGGGGGSSAFWLDGVLLVNAGAGGGAGGMGFISITDDPGGGGSSGKTADSGVNGKGPGAGKGGAGASSGSEQGGNGGQGAYTGGAGGGGGAGNVGGKGGQGGGFGGGGGGGGGAGSSYISPTVLGATINRGTTTDGNGIIYITWSQSAIPQCSDQTIRVPHDSPGVAIQLSCTFASSYRLLSLPDHGFLDNRDLIRGTMTYVPVEGYVGLDSFTFVGVDTNVSAPAIITFEVQ